MDTDWLTWIALVALISAPIALSLTWHELEDREPPSRDDYLH